MPKAIATTRANGFLLALWLCFVARGLFYVMATPVWEGFDEYSHFAYVEQVASGSGLISEKRTVPQDIAESFEFLPLPRAMILQLRDGKPHLDYESYWALNATEREILAVHLRAIRPATRERLESRWIGIYERQQPPLYYWVMARLYWVCRQWSLVDRVMLMRVAGMLLGSTAVPAVYCLVSPLAGVRWGIGAAALAVSIPGLAMTVSRVGNECLAVAVGSGLTLAAAKLARESAEGQEPSSTTALLTGLALSAALLTKAYFLSSAGVLALWLLWCTAKRRKLAVVVIALALGLPVLLAGWWYVRNVLLTGSLSGEQIDSAMQQMQWSSRLAAIGGVQWLRALYILFATHIFVGGWSFVLLRPWMYIVLMTLWMLAAAGVLGRLLMRSRERFGPCSEAGTRRSVVMVVLLQAALVAGLAYHTVATFVVFRESVGNGWYLYSLVGAECFLVPFGLAFWLRECWQAALFPVLAGLFALLDLFAMHIYLMPYYSGLTAHSAHGAVRAWNLWRAGADDWGTLFVRLTANKPETFGSGLVIGLWVAYLAATVGTPIAAWLATRRLEEKAAAL